MSIWMMNSPNANFKAPYACVCPVSLGWFLKRRGLFFTFGVFVKENIFTYRSAQVPDDKRFRVYHDLLIQILHQRSPNGMINADSEYRH
jgi:hypothetical protein